MSSPGGKSSSIPLMGNDEEPTIFELSCKGRKSFTMRATSVPGRELEDLVDRSFLRNDELDLVEVSERDLVAHFTRLSHRQFSVDLGFYPLGSCTMKYNPKFCDEVASFDSLTSIHPATPSKFCQGWLELCFNLTGALKEITGMAGGTLQPAAGAQGELTGLLLIKAYHESRGERRKKVIIPNTAHGTNPASVTLSGYEPVTIGTNEHGLVNIDELKAILDDDVAARMLTNPNTLGLFETEIAEIASLVHNIGGLLYYDGANLNAILGAVRPGDMGFDVVHLNLHKTFATPHGGGGPGAGPVLVSKRLLDFLPSPIVTQEGDTFIFTYPKHSIGRIHSWFGNAVVLARAYAYIVFHGNDGLKTVGELAVLNARYLKDRLKEYFPAAYDSPPMHEAVLTAESVTKETGIKALDIAKGLLDRGFHAPTIYFPLLVHEALMIEPTETESLETVDSLIDSLEEIYRCAYEDPELLKTAPMNTPVSRVDEARAARQLKPVYKRDTPA